MNQYQTWFCIADTNICIITPTPLTVEPAFCQYRSVPTDDAVICVFEEVEELPERRDGSTLTFTDGMHEIYWSKEGVQQYFYIPYLGAPPCNLRKPDLYREMEGFAEKTIHLYYRPEAAHYFATAFGCFNAVKIERLLVKNARFMLHASFIEWNGQAIAFTADSGVGKTTQALLWEKYAGAQMINGDRMVFGMKDGVMHGFGVPVAGSSGVFENRTLPIRAIVLLGRGKINEVRNVRPTHAIGKLMRQITVNRWDQTFMDAVCGGISELLTQIPVYELFATPDEAAVDCLKKMLED